MRSKARPPMGVGGKGSQRDGVDPGAESSETRGGSQGIGLSQDAMPRCCGMSHWPLVSPWRTKTRPVTSATSGRTGDRRLALPGPSPSRHDEKRYKVDPTPAAVAGFSSREPSWLPASPADALATGRRLRPPRGGRAVPVRAGCIPSQAWTNARCSWRSSALQNGRRLLQNGRGTASELLCSAPGRPARGPPFSGTRDAARSRPQGRRPSLAPGRQVLDIRLLPNLCCWARRRSIAGSQNLVTMSVWKGNDPFAADVSSALRRGRDIWTVSFQPTPRGPSGGGLA